MPTPRARQEWANRVRAEYTSAATTAQVLQWSIRFGVPRPLLDTARRIVGDELDHAALSHACLVAVGGSGPLDLDEAGLAVAIPAEGALAGLVDATLHSFLFGETLAVPLFHAMREGASHPAACAALDRILCDEAAHRAFGWELLDALLALDPPGVRGRVEARLPEVTAWFRHAYGGVPDSAPLLEEERAVGLLPPARYRALFAQTLAGGLTRRFAARGISVEVSA